MSDNATELPDHIADSVNSLLRLREERLGQTTQIQRLMQRAVSAVGRASFIALLTLVVLAWTLGNLAASRLGHKPWDAPPFSILQGAVSLVALYTTILILATQRHEDELALHREQLTLQLSLLSEQKSAKIIQLLEELRQDSPHLSNRVDHEAADMARPADPATVLGAITGDRATVSDPAPDNA